MTESYTYTYDHLFAGMTPARFMIDCPISDVSLFARRGADHPESQTFTVAWGEPLWFLELSEHFIEKWHRLRTDLPDVIQLRRAAIANPHIAALLAKRTVDK